MRSTFKVLFYVKKGSAKPNGNLPLMCRLTVDGEIKQFSCNERWNSDQEYIETLKNRVFEAVKKLVDVFGNNNKVGRKYKNGELNTKFNRVLLEVLVFFFDKIEHGKLTIDNNSKFKDLYIKLFEEDFDFQATIDGSTKNMENYKIRYSRIQDIVSEAYGIQGKITPFEYVTKRIRK